MTIKPLPAAFVAGLLAGLILGVAGCKVPIASPTTTTETGDVEATGGSSVWQFNFQSVAGKTGWGVSAITLIALIVSTLKVKHRDEALDTVIEAIEDKQCNDCKRCVEHRNNALVNRRVAKLKQNGPKP